MKRLSIGPEPGRNTKNIIAGPVKEVFILKEGDMPNIGDLLKGYEIDVLYVPRALTQKEMELILPNTINSYIGRVVNYNE